MTAFADLGLCEPTLQALQDVGYEKPSPIQEQAIPPLLQGRDIIGQAQTGSGKTAAFGLPIVEHVDPREREVQALVLTPTRELCIQVTQALRAYGARKGVDVVAVFGGAPIRTQQSQLHDGGQVVVGTVGRVLDLMGRALADPDARAASSCSTRPTRCSTSASSRTSRRSSRSRPNGRQTALFSATMPPPIRKLADRYLYDPSRHQGEVADPDRRHRRAVPACEVEATREGRHARRRARAPSGPTRRSSSCARRSAPTSSSASCATRGMNVKALHGDMSQGQRDGVMLVVQGRPRADPRRHRRRRPRPGHLHGHARHQLRRPDLPRRLRAPHRAHRPRRALGPRDHVRRAAPDARARRDREAHRPGDRAVGRRARTTKPAHIEERPRRHSKPHVVAQRRRALRAS